MILGHPFVPNGDLSTCAECGRVEGSHASTLRRSLPFEFGMAAAVDQAPSPKIGDSSDKDIALASGKRIGGATVEEWIEIIRKGPDRTLPGGVGGALLGHFDEQLGRVYLKLAEANAVAGRWMKAALDLAPASAGAIAFSSESPESWVAAIKHAKEGPFCLGCGSLWSALAPDHDERRCLVFNVQRLRLDRNELERLRAAIARFDPTYPEAWVAAVKRRWDDRTLDDLAADAVTAIGEVYRHAEDRTAATRQLRDLADYAVSCIESLDRR